MLSWLIFGVSFQQILNISLVIGLIILFVVLFVKFPISRWFISGFLVLMISISGIYSGFKINEYHSASGGIFGKLEELINPNKVNVTTSTTSITFDFSQVILTENDNSTYSADFTSNEVLKLNSNENYKVLVNGEPCKIIDYSNSSLIAKYNYSFYGIDGKEILTDELTFTFGFNKHVTNLVVSSKGSADAIALWNSYFAKNEFSVNITNTSDIYVSDTKTARLTIKNGDSVINRIIVPCGSEYELPVLKDTVSKQFIGYSLDGINILANNTITVDFSQVIYAIFKDKTFDISVSLNGGEMVLSDVTYSDEYLISCKSDDIILLSEPTKTLYSFNYWRVYLELENKRFGLIVYDKTFNTSILDIVNEHNDSIIVWEEETIYIENVISVSIEPVFVPDTNNPELLSDNDLIIYIEKCSSLFGVCLETSATCEDEVRRIYAQCWKNDWQTASLFEMMTTITEFFSFDIEFNSETTYREFLEDIYICVWEFNNQ